MIRICKFSDDTTGSVFVSKGRKGTHNVEVWTPRQTMQFEINRKDLPVGQRTKDDLIREAVRLFEEKVKK